MVDMAYSEQEIEQTELKDWVEEYKQQQEENEKSD